MNTDNVLSEDNLFRLQHIYEKLRNEKSFAQMLSKLEAYPLLHKLIIQYFFLVQHCVFKLIDHKSKLFVFSTIRTLPVQGKKWFLLPTEHIFKHPVFDKLTVHICFAKSTEGFCSEKAESVILRGKKVTQLQSGKPKKIKFGYWITHGYCTFSCICSQENPLFFTCLNRKHPISKVQVRISRIRRRKIRLVKIWVVNDIWHAHNAKWKIFILSNLLHLSQWASVLVPVSEWIEARLELRSGTQISQ